LLRRIQHNLNAGLQIFDLEMKRRNSIGSHIAIDMTHLLLSSPARVIFDVGANVGQTYTFYRRKFQIANIYCFEPTPSAFSALQVRIGKDPLATALPVALGDTISESSLNEFRISTANSLLSPLLSIESPSWLRNGKTKLVRQITVDHFCEDQKIDSIDILKIDTQGFDGRVLSGAADTLKRGAIRMVSCEALFESLYEGQSDFDEIYAQLGKYGFKLVDLYEKVRASDGVSLSYANALFYLPSREI